MERRSFRGEEKLLVTSQGVNGEEDRRSRANDLSFMPIRTTNRLTMASIEEADEKGDEIKKEQGSGGK